MNKWDLSVIFKNEEEFYNECEIITKKIKELQELTKDCFKSSNNLYNFLQLDTDIVMLLSRLSSYASMNYDLDTSNNKALLLEEKARMINEEYDKVVSFFMPSLLKLEEGTLDKYYKECPELTDYKIMLDRTYRYKSHTLSEIEEKLLSNMSSIFNRSYKTYETLTDCDLSLGTIKDENNKEIELTDSNYRRYLESFNRKVRKDAFMTMNNGYGAFKNTITSTFFGQVNEMNAEHKIRNYKSILDMLVFGDEVDTKVYKNLVKVVNDNLDTIYNYFKLIKDSIKVDKLHLYDTYVPLINTKNFEYTYEEAKKLVLEAVKVLGTDYVEILKEGYNKGWVDVYPSKAKRSGAYSGGSYLTEPYILLNYDNKYNDVSTLAHESGHSMHSYYTRNNNKPQYGSYRIFVAEVASTVNELLLANYMLDNTDDIDEKKFIICNLMNLFKSTIYRQTMFAEFEEYAYSVVEQGGALTSDQLCEKYLELNKTYFGDDVVVDEEIKYEWLRVPHFYYEFYVYKYATGLSAATYIVNNLKKEGYCEKYKEFLKAGSKLNPIDSLKLADVDLTNEQVITSAIDYFKELQEKYKNLCK